MSKLKQWLILFMCSVAFQAFGSGVVKGQQKIIYKYKKYEKFDFDDLQIEGDTGGPGDLSISPRYQRKFKNKLPYRRNFHPELRRAIERVR